MKIPEYVEFTLNRLEKCGFSAYLVGGCVRDFLMGIEPHDFDIATNASPDEIERCFDDIKTLDVGKKHGTISLVFDKECVEVTTYRIDGEYKDSRHPESVTFTDRIEEDLARRDFTMNAIGYSPRLGFADPFDGKGDIEKKRIVAVGNPEKRFDEDALRIMRALRFSSRLGFEIEKNTKSALFEKKELLLNIAKERINSEFCGILDGKGAFRVIPDYFDIIRTVVPNVSAVNFDALMRGNDFGRLTKLCVFFSETVDLSLLSQTLKDMKFDNNTIKSVSAVVSNLEAKTNDSDIKRTVSKIGVENTKLLYNTIYCLREDLSYLSAVKRLEHFVEIGECMSLQSLDIKGNEIIDAYNSDPSKTGKILLSLLDDVIEKKIPNKKDALVDRAKKYI